MDTHVKEGQLYVQHQKFGKKWKKNWFVLYPASQNGIARLEFYDSHGSGSGSSGGSMSASNEKTRKLDKKIIRLSECISILPALTESCPKENMAAICVETIDKTHVFAAEKNTITEWMDTMCDIAFQGGCGSSSSNAADSNAGPKDLQMADNLIYYSREEVNEFWVTVQRSEASERCGLSGNYWLKAESDVLILKEPKTKRRVLVWPYKLLRRYGRDRVMFSFEAGRRCESGPGNFTFDTKQGNDIFTVVDQAIQSQKALAEEHHLSGPFNSDPDCPSLLPPRGSIPGSGDSSGSCSSREADGDSGGSKPGSADGVLGKREGGDGGRGQASGAVHKGRSLPELPAMLGVLGGGTTPPRSPRGQKSASMEEQMGLYSEPADSVRLHLQGADGLYSDPVDSLKGQKKTNVPCSPPLPTPRLRPVGDDASGSGGGNHHHGGNSQRKTSDPYCNVYNQISALNLNGAAEGGRGGGGRGKNTRPAGGKAEGSSFPPVISLEHIYDEPEGCAKGGGGAPSSLSPCPYEEARLELRLLKKQEALPNASEAEENFSSVCQGRPLDPQRHCAPQAAPGRSTAKGPKPVTAPKPSRSVFARKEAFPPPPGKHAPNSSNFNNNNNNTWASAGAGKEIYSQVSKQKPPHLWYNQNQLRSPDIIYDNLGDI
ncbi:docking protein 1 [Oryzias latipes]|uniref:Docking protein 1b n=1 Tax=Oryzias latipes TaxID=8090 RepID=A0A3B3II47_ORYLA|nr:docking protein 1 [Oryzias latipes]